MLHRISVPLILLPALLSAASLRAEVDFDHERADVDFGVEMPLPQASPTPKTLKQLKAEIPKPGAREVKPENFSQYGIVVDIFRSSSKLPVLGKYRPEYHDTVTATFQEKNAKKRAELAKSRFSNLARAEFAVVSVDGVPVKAHLISAAIESVINRPVKDKSGVDTIDPLTGQKITVQTLQTTPPGNYMLTPRLDETPTSFENRKLGLSTTKELAPFPFLSSSTFERSTMFWGLWIYEGYYIHQTPHYDQLGRPASMGCIRQSNPDARWLWDLVTNQSEGRKAMIRIHAMHSRAAYLRLREMFRDSAFAPKPEDVYVPAAADSKDITWLLGELNANYQSLKDWMKKKKRHEYEGVGHGWYNAAEKKFDEPVLPLCAGQECVELWGDPLKKIAKLKQNDEKARLKVRAEQIKQGLPIPRADSIALKLIPPALPVAKPAQ